MRCGCIINTKKKLKTVVQADRCIEFKFQGSKSCVKGYNKLMNEEKLCDW